MAILPLNELVLRAGSVADDLGFVALADVATAFAGTEALVIGGHMVQLHVYRWGLGADLYRQTQDADLGVARIDAKDPALTERLKALGYQRTGGNRFERAVADIPITAPVGDARCAVVEVLVPAYTSRPRDTLKLGDHLPTTEVPGLADALKRPAVSCNLRLTRLNGQVLSTHVTLPDEVSAFVLKVMSWQHRLAQRDAVDLWRGAEVLVAAGLNLSGLSEKSASSVQQALASVSNRRGLLVESIVKARGFSEQAGDRLHTRLCALAARLTES